RADEAGATGNENAHSRTSFLTRERVRASGNPLQDDDVARHVVLAGRIQFSAARDQGDPLLVIGLVRWPDDLPHRNGVAMVPFFGKEAVGVRTSVFHRYDDFIALSEAGEPLEGRRDAVVVHVRREHRVAGARQLFAPADADPAI